MSNINKLKIIPMKSIQFQQKFRENYRPISTYIAIKDQNIIGFSSYDSAYLNFLGPMGISKEYRKMGIGKALLYLSLKSMKEMGYAYAIIGGVGPAKFYETTFGAKIIEGSDPGIYKGILSHVPV